MSECNEDNKCNVKLVSEDEKIIVDDHSSISPPLSSSSAEVVEVEGKELENDDDCDESGCEQTNPTSQQPTPLIPKQLLFDSKLIQYISEYRDEIKVKKSDLLECEVKSLEVLMNEQGFQYVTRKMMGKEYLEEAFFIEFVESYCSDYYNFLHGGEELNQDDDETNDAAVEEKLKIEELDE